MVSLLQILLTVSEWETERPLDTLYKSLGDFLKRKCKGSTAFIYFGDRVFIKRFGLKPAWKKAVENRRS